MGAMAKSLFEEEGRKEFNERIRKENQIEDIMAIAKENNKLHMKNNYDQSSDDEFPSPIVKEFIPGQNIRMYEIIQKKKEENRDKKIDYGGFDHIGNDMTIS